VEDFLVNLLGNASGGLASYALVFGILFICGLGVPLPEDVSLILGGFLVYEGKAELLRMMAVGYLGIIIGDSMIYFAGRRLGSKVGQSPSGFFARIITPEKRARVEGLFKRHGEKIIILARFMPGVRAVTYFTAGSVGMRYRIFALFDSLAALASAPFFVYLGWRFGGKLDWLFEQIKSGQRTVVGVILVVLAVAFFVSRRRAKREAALNSAALAESQQAARQTTTQ
jgi:membrane protein DedA with SNARE-associated domain